VNQPIPVLLNEIRFSFEQLKEHFSRIFFLCDKNTFKFCFTPHFSSFVPKENVFVLEAGDAHKTLENAGLFCTFLLENQADKNALVINLGGGMISDLGGFSASIYQRGIEFVNMPTTLLSVADASLGGKTAVNLHHTKNTLGLFAHPHSILFSPQFLLTLPKDEWLSGWAEIIKSVLLFDSTKWEEINQLEQLPLSTNKQSLSLIEFCWKHKSKVVDRDFFDKGVRQALNYGHSIGHVIESMSIREKKPLLHGFAIAAGMKYENLISAKLGLMDGKEAIKINLLLEQWFPVIRKVKPEFSKEFANILLNDKKNKTGKLNMSLLSKPGKFYIQQEVPTELIEEVFNQTL
jgi:3-dehydroquinate synthase